MYIEPITLAVLSVLALLTVVWAWFCYANMCILEEENKFLQERYDDSQKQLTSIMLYNRIG